LQETGFNMNENTLIYRTVSSLLYSWTHDSRLYIGILDFFGEWRLKDNFHKCTFLLTNTPIIGNQCITSPILQSSVTKAFWRWLWNGGPKGANMSPLRRSSL